MGNGWEEFRWVYDRMRVNLETENEKEGKGKKGRKQTSGRLRVERVCKRRYHVKSKHAQYKTYDGQ